MYATYTQTGKILNQTGENNQLELSYIQGFQMLETSGTKVDEKQKYLDQTTLHKVFCHFQAMRKQQL